MRRTQPCHVPLGWSVTEGMECMVGSLIHLTGTFVFHSHTRIFLSSWRHRNHGGNTHEPEQERVGVCARRWRGRGQRTEVEMKRRPSSTKVTVLTAARW